LFDDACEADELSLALQQHRQAIEEAVHRLQHALLRRPRSAEIARWLGLPLPEYQHLVHRVQGPPLVALDERSANRGRGGHRRERQLGDSRHEPLAVLLERRRRDAVVQAIEALPPRERAIVALYHEQGLTLKAIATLLGVTESRTSQLHSQAMARLRERLRGH
jgi:RNA polymerase sigma factor for flagellar operon FliA